MIVENFHWRYNHNNGEKERKENENRSDAFERNEIQFDNQITDFYNTTRIVLWLIIVMCFYEHYAKVCSCFFSADTTTNVDFLNQASELSNVDRRKQLSQQ